MAPAEFSWSVPVEHPAFAGHFPGRPIVPGVVLLDQALLFAEQWSGVAAVGWQLANAKFLSPVGPGESLQFTLSVTARGSIAISIRGDGREVASGTQAALKS